MLISCLYQDSGLFCVSVQLDMMDTSVTEEKSVGRNEQNSAVTVSLHPLVIMNISEHMTRMRAQTNDGRPIEVSAY